ncbi:hypothetical protein ACQP3L_31005, partial [Escherichia coli]
VKKGHDYCSQRMGAGNGESTEHTVMSLHPTPAFLLGLLRKRKRKRERHETDLCSKYSDI